MVIAHLMVGFLAGALAAVTSLVMGYSFWSAVGFYIVGGNLGMAGVIPLLLLGRLSEAADDAFSGTFAAEGEYRQAS
jgi:hypothetical protein